MATPAAPICGTASAATLRGALDSRGRALVWSTRQPWPCPGSVPLRCQQPHPGSLHLHLLTVATPRVLLRRPLRGVRRLRRRGSVPVLCCGDAGHAIQPASMPHRDDATQARLRRPVHVTWPCVLDHDCGCNPVLQRWAPGAIVSRVSSHDRGDGSQVLTRQRFCGTRDLCARRPDVMSLFAATAMPVTRST